LVLFVLLRLLLLLRLRPQVVANREVHDRGLDFGNRDVMVQGRE
jgi:hypothetical protein